MTTHETENVSLETDLTVYRAADTKQYLLDAVRRARALDLDLSRVGEMDTSGFQLLVMAKRESQRLGHSLRIVGHSPAVLEVIEFYGMAGYFGDPLVIPATSLDPAEAAHG